MKQFTWIETPDGCWRKIGASFEATITPDLYVLVERFGKTVLETKATSLRGAKRIVSNEMQKSFPHWF